MIWSPGGHAVWSNGSSLQRPSSLEFSDLGGVAGGATVAAGTALPATSGRVIPTPGGTAWIRITGTTAKAGDGVVAVYEGRRTAVPTNPAARFVCAAGPGAPGIDVLADGTIEITLNGTNSDNNYVYWRIVPGPV